MPKLTYDQYMRALSARKQRVVDAARALMAIHAQYDLLSVAEMSGDLDLTVAAVNCLQRLEAALGWLDELTTRRDDGEI